VCRVIGCASGHGLPAISTAHGRAPHRGPGSCTRRGTVSVSGFQSFEDKFLPFLQLWDPLPSFVTCSSSLPSLVICFVDACLRQRHVTGLDQRIFRQQWSLRKDAAPRLNQWVLDPLQLPTPRRDRSPSPSDLEVHSALGGSTGSDKSCVQCGD